MSAVCGGAAAADTWRPDTWPHPGSAWPPRTPHVAVAGVHWHSRPSLVGQVGRRRPHVPGLLRDAAVSAADSAARTSEPPAWCGRMAGQRSGLRPLPQPPPDTGPQPPAGAVDTLACCGTAPPQRSGRTAAQLRRGHPREPGRTRLPACRFRSRFRVTSGLSSSAASCTAAERRGTVSPAMDVTSPSS
jgi:hypothetical protein